MKSIKICFSIILLSFCLITNASDFKIGELAYTIIGDDFVSVSYDGDRLTIDDIIKLEPKDTNNQSYIDCYKENWDNYFFTDKVIEVPSKVEYDGKSYIVTAVEKAGFLEAADLYKVILPETVNTIGEMAFKGSTVREISLPSSLILIDNYAFTASAIKNITFPNQIRFLGKELFYRCFNLDNITFEPNSIISYIPTSCFEYSGLKEIILPESIKILGDHAFENSNLHIFTSGNLDEIGEACFKECGLYEFNCKRVREIKQEAFYRCYLKELEIDTDILGYNSLNCGYHCGTRIVRFINNEVPKGLSMAFGFRNDGPAGVIAVPEHWYWINDDFTENWVSLSFNFRYDKIEEFGFTFYKKPDKNSYIHISPYENIFVRKGSDLTIGWKADNMNSFEVRHNGEIIDPDRLSEYTVDGLEHNVFYHIPDFEDSTRIYMTSTTGINKNIYSTDVNELYDIYSISGHLIGKSMTAEDIDILAKGTYILKSENSVKIIRK